MENMLLMRLGWKLGVQFLSFAESSEKTGKIKSIDSRDFWKILSMTSMEICECGSGWQGLFVAQITYLTPTP